MNETIETLQDEILVLRAQQGQGDAFKEMVRRWQQRLWNRAFQVTRDEEAAWDIVQNTWKKVIQSLGSLENPAAFPGWILKLTNNLAIDWIRHEVRSRELHESYAETVRENHADSPFHLHEVHVAISQLDAKDSEIVTLFYLDEMDITEISDLLGIPPGTVKSRLYYARTKLKTILEATT